MICITLVNLKNAVLSYQVMLKEVSCVATFTLTVHDTELNVAIVAIGQRGSCTQKYHQLIPLCEY